MLSKLFLYPSCTAVVINHEAHVFFLFKHVPQKRRLVSFSAYSIVTFGLCVLHYISPFFSVFF